MSESNTTFLNRWLDRTPMRQLERTKTFIIVPAFSVVTGWLGFSDIVGIYDYSAPHNFTLRNLAGLPTGTNYTMIISYINSDRTVKRFRLIDSADSVIYGDIPEYRGQVIKKNFRIEIWSTPVGDVTQSVDLTLNASVLNNTDPRYGTDTSLVTANRFSTDFDNDSTGLPDLTNCTMRYLGSNITKDGSNHISLWAPTTGTINLTPTGVPTYRHFGYVEGAQCLGTVTLDGSDIVYPLEQVYIQIFGNVGVESNNKILTFKNGSTVLFQIQSQLRSSNAQAYNYKITKNTDVLYVNSEDGILIVDYCPSTGVINVYHWPTGDLLATHAGTVGAILVDTISLGDSAGTALAGSIVCQILGYSAAQSVIAKQQTLEYLVGTPFVWPYNPILNSDSLIL